MKEKNIYRENELRKKKGMLFTREVNTAIGNKVSLGNKWKMKEGQSDGSSGNGACCQARQPEFEPRHIHGGKRERTLPRIHMPWHMLSCSPLHASNSLKGEINGLFKKEDTKRPP